MTEREHAPNNEPTQPIHWTTGIGENCQCANCGAVRTGTYCPACGQKHLRHRVQLGELVKDLLARISNLDRGLLHTLIAVLRGPGAVAKDYVTGKQRPYLNPLAYFFIGAAMQLLVLWLLEDAIRQKIDQGLRSNPAIANQPQTEQLEQMLGEDLPTAMVHTYMVGLKQAYSYAALLFFAFPMAVLLMLLHRISGENFKLGETSIFALYAVGQMLVVTACATLVITHFAPDLQVLVGPVLYLLVAWQSHSGFFKRTWLSRVMTCIAVLISIGIFFVSIVGIVFASFAFRIWLASV